jgi:hypothetical protein
MTDPELHREANDRYFGSEPPVNHGDVGAGERSAPPEPDEDDEPDRFAVRIVYLDGVERIDSNWPTEWLANKIAGRARENLEAAGYDKSRVHVDVVDLDDPERRIEE